MFINNIINIIINNALENYRWCLLRCHLAEIQRMRFSDTNTYCAIKKDESRIRSWSAIGEVPPY